jgi:hypothetical protein
VVIGEIKAFTSILKIDKTTTQIRTMRETLILIDINDVNLEKLL